MLPLEGLLIHGESTPDGECDAGSDDDGEFNGFHRIDLLPRRSCGFDRLARLRKLLAGQLVEGQPLAEDGRSRFDESLGVRHLAVVEPIDLFVEIAKQMKRFERYIGALEGALEQRPEVLAPVGVDLPVHVAFGVNDDIVDVVRVQPIVREQLVGVDVRPASNVLADLGLKDGLAILSTTDARTVLWPSLP
jgi:hypothetical protein